MDTHPNSGNPHPSSTPLPSKHHHQWLVLLPSRPDTIPKGNGPRGQGFNVRIRTNS